MSKEIAKNRLEELKLHEENRRKEAMRSRQLAERLGVEEGHARVSAVQYGLGPQNGRL